MKNILIVDDEKILVDTMKSLVLGIDKSFKVTGAYDGMSALDLIKVNKTDILITDINMPEMDGLELIRSVQKEHSSIKIIVMSGEGDVYTRAAKAFGAAYILKKPFGKKELKSAIDDVCIIPYEGNN